MDCRPVLESIVRVLSIVPGVEDQLVVFDSLVNVSEPEHRPEAAQMLRGAAASSSDPERRERLLRAAEAVDAGRPCAFTPDGLSAQQAAASQTVTAAEWEQRVARSPLPPPPGGSEAHGDEEAEGEDGGADEDPDESDFVE
jgi:hypothetical protein